jgi:hypothetical protein
MNIMDKTVDRVVEAIKKRRPAMYAASGAEDAVKVLAEYKYDALAETKYFRKLKSLEMKEKLIIVAVMFALNAHFKVKMTEDTPWNLFLKGILTDFFPEMGKRLINGDTSPSPNQEEQEVIDLVRQTGKSERYEPKKEKGFPKNATNPPSPLKMRLAEFLANNDKGV